MTLPVQRSRRRFALEGPKARYVLAATVLESTLVAMSLWLPGSGRLDAYDLSQGLQIESRRQKPVEALEQEPPEPEQVARQERNLDRDRVRLTRFHIVESEPLSPAPAETEVAPTPVDPEYPEALWLRRISQRKVEPTPEEVEPSPASIAKVRLEPLQGKCPKPRYPVRAVRLGMEGSVRFRIHVDARGKVSRLEVLEQDCPRILLMAARTALLQWQFQGGPGTYEKRVVFALEDGH